ncbi:MAG: asparaginase [Anaerolineales bacterium]|nr:asparaginase [Anaerolineales bacterium]HUS84299.1 asparaginase [Anaerolineales bacterium]
MSEIQMVDISRGGIVESSHQVAAVVADVHGEVLARWGNVNFVTFLRSSAKPFQGMPLVASGAAAHFELSEQELAVVCASHAGTDEHIQVTNSILRKIGLSEADLRCGTHIPFDNETSEALILAGEKPSPIRHNCSGKHAGMLAVACYLKAPIQTYLEPDHPVQQQILHNFSEMVSMAAADIIIGIDGCSAPNFAVPLRNAATAYARLMDPGQFSTSRAESCRAIVSAMTAYPEMISGEGRFDTLLMQVTSAQLLSKGGAEGFQGIGIPPESLSSGSPALGVALKVLDGDLGSRARSVATIAVLEALGILPAEERRQLKQFDSRPMLNQSGLRVGEIRSPQAVWDAFNLTNE